ncbi:MAG TPA: sulfite exporter TauE/SafE family protein [Baekduia sp.]
MSGGAIAVGFVAGVVAGMLGVGGGILFVPGLVLFLNLPQVDAEATSLLAIIPVALVGAANQRRYGNLRTREALLLGLLAIPGAIGGVAIVNAIPQRATEILFALLLLYVASRMARDAISTKSSREGAES